METVRNSLVSPSLSGVLFNRDCPIKHPVPAERTRGLEEERLRACGASLMSSVLILTHENPTNFPPLRPMTWTACEDDEYRSSCRQNGSLSKFLLIGIERCCVYSPLSHDRERGSMGAERVEKQEAAWVPIPSNQHRGTTHNHQQQRETQIVGMTF